MLRIITLVFLICTLSTVTRGTIANSVSELSLPVNPELKGHPVKVFILSGQSNAVGYNTIKDLHELNEEVQKSIRKESQILFWPGSNARPGFENTWTTLQPGVSGISAEEPYRDSAFGPEIGFAIDIQNAFPDERIALIKYAEGGTGIARSADYEDYIPALKGFDDHGRNWHPPVLGQEPGILYKNLLDNIQSALSVLKSQEINYEIAGFLWMQGEHEAGISKKMAADYGNLLRLFRESVRHDLNLENLPFMVGEINSHTWAFADIARKVQAEACQNDPDSRLVRSTDLTRGSIGGEPHFDANGMLQLGNRFAEGFKSLSSKTGYKGQSVITFGTLLEELTDRSAVTQWPAPGFRLLQASSYDRRSVEKDKEGWFANDDWSNYIRKEINQGREEYVVMDADGPGAITRFWAAGHPNQKNHLRFYIDGQDKPFWEADHTGALIGQNNSIGIPLSQRSVDRDSLNINKGAQPGHNLYAPIPFAGHIKITSDVPKGGAGTGFWYNINYRLYDKDVKVESFSKETPAKYENILKYTSQKLNRFMDLSPLTARADGEKVTDHCRFSLNPGELKTLHIKESGVVKRLLITLNSVNVDDAVKNSWLRMEFDGKVTVDVPVGFFFGCGDQLVASKDWYRKVDAQGNMASFWVMPFREYAVINLMNKGDKKISGSIEMATDIWKWDDHSMYFHAGYKKLDEMPAKTNKDFNFIDLKDQQGVYVSDILQVYKNFRGWWGEGDEKIYIDGSTFPDHFGTGSEDYYGYAWGHPETFSNIFTGQPIGNANTGESGTSVNSRVRSLDAIPFKKSLRFDMESWQMYGGPVKYDLATFWYGK